MRTFPNSKDGTPAWVGLDQILDILRDRRYLDDEAFTAAKRIQEHGNNIAHYTSRTDRVVHTALRKRQFWPYTIEDIEPAPLEILADLRSGAEILLGLARSDLAAARAAEARTIGPETPPGP